MTDAVVFAGVRHDGAAMISAMDLFIASSEQETFGLSVLEALANGLPGGTRPHGGLWSARSRSRTASVP